MLTESEMKFAELIWEHEPVASGDLVRLCEKKMQWKKSTTYTMLKKLCDKGIFQNRDAVVSSLMTKEEYIAKQSIRFVEDTFGGSLPMFLTAFMSSKKLNRRQAEELKKLIDEYREDEI
jgi:BlaI family penicillinase repressor